MSDDTPTERFSPTGDEPTRRLPQQPQDAERLRPLDDSTPTERYTRPPVNVTAPAAASGPPRPPRGPRRDSNASRIALIVVGSLLAAAIAVLLLVLATRNGVPAAAPSVSESATPTSTPTPTETPAETPSPTPTEPEPTATQEVPVQGAEFTSFSPTDNSAVACSDETSSVPLTFSWSSTGAESAWIGVGTDDAKAEPFAQVDPTDTFKDISYQCENESEIYTVTLDDGAGTLTNATVTLVRELG